MAIPKKDDWIGLALITVVFTFVAFAIWCVAIWCDRLGISWFWRA